MRNCTDLSEANINFTLGNVFLKGKDENILCSIILHHTLSSLQQ